MPRLCRSPLAIVMPLVLASSFTAEAATLYVDANVIGGTGDGSSWANAFGGASGLQDALAASASGDEIWVADGVYLPTAGAARTASFVMRSGVAIHGGFDGGESTLEERDPSAHHTILSGDLAGNDGGGVPGNDNVYHVVRAEGGAISATSRLTGVIVRGGNANAGSDPNDRGGGMFIQNGAQPRFEDVIFDNNRCTFGGGAGYVRNASPSYVRCTFMNGDGGNFGGAFDIFSSGPAVNVTFDACRVYGNRAGRAGGIEAFGNVTVRLTNTLVAGNTTTGQGGGLFVAQGADAFIESSTIAENRATGDTGGVHLSGGSLIADNSIIATNNDPSGTGSFAQVNLASATLRWCVVSGGWSGGGSDNLDGDPQLLDASNGSALIGAGSIAADAGNNTLVPAGLMMDIDGAPRYGDDDCGAETGVPGGGRGTLLVDIGASERVGTFVDCNRNGMSDECEVASGSAADCDGNGIPDSCDIAAGAEDCNDNGVIDQCEVAQQVVLDSGMLGPIGGSSPQSYVVPATAEPSSDVMLIVEASADLDQAFELVSLRINGVVQGNIFGVAADCADPPSQETLTFTAAEWLALVPSGQTAVIDFVPNGAVGATECGGNSWISGRVTFLAAGSNDRDQNGIPDDCDGAPCPADFARSGAVDFSDLVSVLSEWGPCEDGEPCPQDLDTSGAVDFNDLLAVLATWGPCP